MKDGKPADQDIETLLRQSITTEPRTAVTPLGAAGIGVAAFIAGAAIVALWPADRGPADPATISVYSCAEQYTTIANSLNELVAEGIDAGQSQTPDVSWINSIHARQEVFTAQLESLGAECIDANGS
jgi:hypothetical protein